jgi:hypothetical protein
MSRDEPGQPLVAIDAKPAARRHLQGAGDLVGLLQLVEDLRAPLIVLAPDLGQAHAPSGAVEQTHAKCGFQRLDLIADRCRRHVEAARSKARSRARRESRKDLPHWPIRQRGRARDHEAVRQIADSRRPGSAPSEIKLVFSSRRIGADRKARQVGTWRRLIPFQWFVAIPRLTRECAGRQRQEKCGASRSIE